MTFHLRGIRFLSANPGEHARKGIDVLFQHSGSRARRRLQLVADGSAMGLSVVLATMLRHDFSVPDQFVSEAFLYALTASLVFVACGAARGHPPAARRARLGRPRPSVRCAPNPSPTAPPSACLR